MQSITQTEYVGALCLYVSGQDLYIKKGNKFSSIHFSKAIGITSHYSGQPLRRINMRTEERRKI